MPNLFTLKFREYVNIFGRINQKIHSFGMQNADPFVSAAEKLL
jgi:hypothetical protein